ncbi:hypothetical protein A1507_19500 [Methylomonas koyamae]|uniref:Terminase n=1 Tax=Methylomonas koyamae TaxID=702114 RepID=A0A177N2L6_9GAMM|nr:hypothetical protein [Methylomonas koyamae]OAI11894.1 hypothetical protein A1507_19500 [Methylomonas koyamae]
MAKLSKEQWADIRRRWEADERDGHQWLADELTAQGYEVNRATIAKAASRQGWAKNGQENIASKNVTQSDKTSRENVTQNVTLRDEMSLTNVTPAPTEKPVPEATPETDSDANAEPQWEEVDEAEARHGGRPSKYMPHFDRQARLLCRLGATDAELAEFFMVSESTINLWKLNYITFSESIKSGKVWADAEAADGLFRRATGFRYKEVKTKQVRPMAAGDGEGSIVAAGDDDLQVVEVVTTEKEVPPDTSAAFIWLRNRRPKDWRDKIEVENTTKLDPEMLVRIKTVFVERMAAARERQRKVLIERGLIDEN